MYCTLIFFKTMNMYDAGIPSGFLTDRFSISQIFLKDEKTNCIRFGRHFGPKQICY